VLRIRGSSRVFAVLGDPVAHSASPAMHNAAIAALGLDAVYVAFRVAPTALPTMLEACAAAGMGGNLTVPHKQAGADRVPHLTPLARALGAVNTFWTDAGALHGDNTDVAGIGEALDALGAEPPWLLCGTGGSARATVAAALRRGAALLIRSRDPGRAAAFAAWTVEAAAALGLAPVEVASDEGQAARTVVNATPQGLAGGDPPPLPAARWRGAHAALDLTYRPGGTAWTRACREAGLRASDGGAVLVAQGAHAFERFFPGTPAPRDVMTAAVARFLAP